jgi:hypothetical protein
MVEIDVYETFFSFVNVTCYLRFSSVYARYSNHNKQRIIAYLSIANS